MAGDPNISSDNPEPASNASCAQTPPGLEAGRTVGAGRFSLIRQIGRGGMGVVWLAQDVELKDEVALKFLAADVTVDEAALDDLRRETRNSRRLTHPNIVRIHDFYATPGEAAFISMEYVAGQNLTTLRLAQPQRCFTWEYLRPLMVQLCHALEYAHGKKVIHRDLKPSNLMLDTEGNLKLADFGIAATISNSSGRVSLREATSGTVTYMSPQQMNGETPRATDDIYALGATLYELLAGRPPFYGGDIVHQVQSVPAMPLAERLKESQLQNQVPPFVNALISDCLAKEPADRPQSAADVLARLVGVVPDSPSGKPWLKWAAGILFLVICVAGVWFALPHDGKNSSSVANNPRPTATPVKLSAADQDKAVNAVQLGDRAFLGLDGHANYPEALRQYKIAADKNYPAAFGRMGMLCDFVPGLAGGPEQKSNWFSKGADLKDPISMIQRARDLGKGSPEAAELFGTAIPEIKRLAEAGDPMNEYWTARIYQNGYGVDRDYPKALKWFRKGADETNFAAMKEIGFMYGVGYGVQKDNGQHIRWICRAAEAGNVSGENDLGYMYRDGIGLEKDYSQALKWLTKAAADGHAGAQEHLGRMYENGWGVPKSRNEAIRLYRLAAEFGSTGASDNLKRILAQ